MSKQTTTLLMIDPQNDFVDPSGSLSVAGADEDAKRLVKLLERIGHKITSIAISLDSHQRLDISHPLWFFDSSGNPPPPFTIITERDLIDDVWQTRDEMAAYTMSYLKSLERQGRYPHVIWPEHCLIGSEGHLIYPMIRDALNEWSSRPANIDFVFKGQNPITEHFSAIEAEVPDPSDPNTQVNRKLIDQLSVSDEVWVCGWARSHCVGNTLRDMFKWGGRSLAEKTVIISDTMSDVPGFESLGESAVRESLSLGASIADVDQLIRKA